MQRDRPQTEQASRLDPFGAFLSCCADDSVAVGPLAGLRLAVKDNIAVKGQPFTAGLPIFADRLGAHDAPVVQTLRDAGARFAGMTQTDAAGFGVTTPAVSNPALPGHTAGGSSGGAAAAVAADLADIGLGTDTGGSVRIPAACCGLFGFKPTHGRISTGGVWPLAPSFDTVGLMTRDLPTLGRAASALLADRAAFSAPAIVRLGIDFNRLAMCDPAVVAAFERALKLMPRAGVALQSITLPDHGLTTEAHGALVLDEARGIYPQWRNMTGLPDLVRRSLLAAEQVTPQVVLAAQRAVQRIGQAFAACCADVDAIVTPTLPVPPPRAGIRRMTLNGRDQSVISILVSETCLANVTGGPALSMPLHDGQGTFVSLQLLAPRDRDLHLLEIANRLAHVLAGNIDFRETPSS